VTRYEPHSCMLVFAAAFLFSAGFGALIIMLMPRTPPPSVDPTPTMLVIVTDPTRPVVAPPSPPPHTPTPPEPLLLTPTNSPVPPTSTPEPTMTSTPTIETTKRPMEQKG
jgi:hypothetical protein